MSFLYSSDIITGLFDLVLTQLSLGGSPTLEISASDGTLLASLPFTAPLEKNRTETVLVLNPPDAALVLADGEASSASLINGSAEPVVLFSVGSATVNPTAELIISSTTLYAGGMITVSKVELTT